MVLVHKFPRNVDLQPHVWRESVLICVITMPSAHVRCDGCEESFIREGFPAPLRVAGEVHRTGEESMHETITRAHRAVLEDFVAAKLHDRWHLLVLEDDARLQYSDPEHRLARALDKLKQWGHWTCLHVGHVPLGPCLPLGWNMCRSSLPYTAHAILYNKKRLANINPKQRWGRPWFFEGMLAVPLDERFAMLPSICGQSVTPKEMEQMPLIKNMTYRQGETVMMVMGIIEACVILFLASYGGLYVAKGLLQKKQTARIKYGGVPVQKMSCFPQLLCEQATC